MRFAPRLASGSSVFLMPLDNARRKTLYGACDPTDALDPSDPRNVELGDRVRGSDWTARLAREFELADRPLLRLFSGLPGSGKSTELRRLGARLSSEDGAHLLVVAVDVESFIDLTVPLRSQEVLLAMFHESERHVRALEGLPETAPRSAFWRTLANLRVEPGKVEVGSPPLKLVFDFKNDPTLRESLDRWVREQHGVFFSEIRDAFADLQRRSIALGYQGMVLLVDSLEKLRGISTNFDEVLKSGEVLFSAGAPHLRLPVHTLYTLPPAVVHRLQEKVVLLPMIKLRDRDGRPHPPGFEAAREIVARRVPDADLDELFGAVEREARVREIIAESGGYPREIVRLLREVISTPGSLGERELRRILIESGDAYRRVAESEGKAGIWFLARVHVSRGMLVNPSERELAARLMASNLILRYQNDDTWFDVHPAILELPLFRAAVDRMRVEDPFVQAEPAPEPG